MTQPKKAKPTQKTGKIAATTARDGKTFIKDMDAAEKGKLKRMTDLQIMSFFQCTGPEAWKIQKALGVKQSMDEASFDLLISIMATAEGDAQLAYEKLLTFGTGDAAIVYHNDDGVDVEATSKAYEEWQHNHATMQFGVSIAKAWELLCGGQAGPLTDVVARAPISNAMVSMLKAGLKASGFKTVDELVAFFAYWHHFSTPQLRVKNAENVLDLANAVGAGMSWSIVTNAWQKEVDAETATYRDCVAIAHGDFSSVPAAQSGQGGGANGGNPKAGGAGSSGYDGKAYQPPADRPIYEGPATRGQLLDFISKRYSIEMLKTACVLWDIDFDSISGDTIQGKARELILKMERIEALPRLQMLLAGVDPEKAFQINQKKVKVNLYTAMTSAFNLDELKIICFKLDWGWESIPGDTIGVKASGLIDLATRKGELRALARELYNDRPGNSAFDPYLF